MPQNGGGDVVELFLGYSNSNRYLNHEPNRRP